mgnify:CR=1 FL=1
MTTLGELANLIPSKNEGLFNLNFDIMFQEEKTYQKFINSGTITRENFEQIYNLPEE